MSAPLLDGRPRLLAFVCNWACYTPAERAEVEQALAGPGDRLVRMPCSGRVSPEMLLAAVQEGFAVLVVGCQAASCHYREGSRLARERLETLHRFLAYLGLEPGRVQLSWRSAGGGRPFRELVAEARAAAQEQRAPKRLVRAVER